MHVAETRPSALDVRTCALLTASSHVSLIVLDEVVISSIVYMHQQHYLSLTFDLLILRRATTLIGHHLM
jgi:hypothetical protein